MPTTRLLRWAALTAVLVLLAVAGGFLASTLAPGSGNRDLARTEALASSPASEAAGSDGAGDEDADEPAPSPSPTGEATEEPADEPSQESAASDAAREANALAGVLPGEVPDSLSREFVVAAGSSPAPGPGRVRTIRVEVERGLPVDADVFAEFVMTTLNDSRGWGARGAVSFARTDGDADIRVLVASPGTVDAMCAPLRTNGTWSCGRYGHAALNADRWVYGSDAFNEASGGDLLAYRQYLVNHEVGHLLGHQHTGCPSAGAVAPVMLQQSITLDGCVPNGWPYP